MPVNLDRRLLPALLSAALAVAWAVGVARADAPPTLASGDQTLAFVAGPGGMTPAVSGGGATVAATDAAVAYVVGAGGGSAGRVAAGYATLRAVGTGATLTLVHVAPDGATVDGLDDDAGRVVDARLRYASLGVRRDPPEGGRPGGIGVRLRFPGTEGEQTRIEGYRRERRSAERLHPLVVGARQSCRFRVDLRHAGSFADQMRFAWRSAWAEADPPVAGTDVAATCRASIDALAFYHDAQDGGPVRDGAIDGGAGDWGVIAGTPFAVRVPAGTVRNASWQMGFVGQQLPCASHLIDEGLRRGDDAMVLKGEQVADFWARESLSPAGVPRTWFDLRPRHFRDYKTYLRVATDGTSGLLRAWQLERAAGRDRPAWLAYCRAVGDWLLSAQADDGSFARSYDFDGRPVEESRTSTLHPVRLLVDLSCATGDARYRVAAVRAAEWSLAANADGATYVGGTPDNPDVKDKEAGWIAFDSYLALFDVTGDPRWLGAAEDAATFAETWVYGWSPPIPSDAAKVTVPPVGTLAGANLIAAGHSGADNFLACAALGYLRLWVYTGDAHWADVATLLQRNSAQFVDVGGSLGYGHEGLLIEAFGISVARGRSVASWLPWCTSAIVEPMARCREAFGTNDVTDARARPIGDLRAANRAFAATRGFGP